MGDTSNGASTRPVVIVIGSGIVGLSTALTLAARGRWRVVCVSASGASLEALTSYGAGGIFEWPPFGVPGPAALPWAAATFMQLTRQHAADGPGTTGIGFRQLHYCYPSGISAARVRKIAERDMKDAPAAIKRTLEFGAMEDIPEIAAAGVAPGDGSIAGDRLPRVSARDDLGLGGGDLDRHQRAGGCGREAKAMSGAPPPPTRYTYTAPVVHMPTYLGYLRRRCDAAGVHFVTQRVRSLEHAVFTAAAALTTTAMGRPSGGGVVHAVVNCTGLGAAGLRAHERADDTGAADADADFTPTKGVLVFVRGPGVHDVYSNEDDDDAAGDLTYVRGPGSTGSWRVGAPHGACPQPLLLLRPQRRRNATQSSAAAGASSPPSRVPRSSTLGPAYAPPAVGARALSSAPPSPALRTRGKYAQSTTMGTGGAG